MIQTLPPPPALPGQAERQRATAWGVAAVIALGVFAVYRLSAPPGGPTPFDHYVRLAEAFLEGRLDLGEAPAYLEVAEAGGRIFVIPPPLPAVLAVPLVWVSGGTLDQRVLSALFGGVGAAAAYLVATRIAGHGRERAWLVVLFCFGTIQWVLAADGSTWYTAHVGAAAFLMLAVAEALGRQRPWVIGLALGAAYWTRLPTILTAPFFLIITAGRWRPGRRRVDAAYLIALAGGLALFVGLNEAYNWLRFGTPGDVAYLYRRGLAEEPWFDRGLFSLSYVPRHLRIALLGLPVVRPDPPFLLPSWIGMAVWLTTPAFALALRAPRTRETAAAWAGILPVALLDASHGNPGIAQFGYRFAMDFYPLLFLLTARGFGRSRWGRALIVASVAVNLWGVVWTNRGWVGP